MSSQDEFETMKVYNTTRLPLLVLKVLGLYSETKSKKALIFATLYGIIGLYIEVTALIQLPYIKDVTEFIEHVLLFNAVGQYTVKVVIFARQQENFHKILDDTKCFWKISSCPKQFQITLHLLQQNTIRLQKLFLYSCTASAIVVSLGLLAGRKLPLGVWGLPGHNILYKSSVVSNIISVQVMATFLPGFDNIFVALAIEAAIQFRILCYRLKELKVSDIISETTEKEYYGKLTLCIQHHNFLLRFMQSLQDCYSGAMLIEYCTISSIICAAMYALLFESNNMQLMIKHSMITTSVVLQLAFYCFAAHIVTFEASTVADATYGSDWYSKYSPKLRHPMILLTQRSQRKFNFTAGGLVQMNISTLLVVLRMSYSACTIMRGLRNKHQMEQI